MGWKAAIVSEPAASRGSSTGRTKAGQMAAGTAHARWGSAHRSQAEKDKCSYLMPATLRVASGCLRFRVCCAQGLKAFVSSPVFTM